MVVGSKQADRFVRDRVLLLRLLPFGQARFRSPASGAAVQQMSVVKKTVEHGRTPYSIRQHAVSPGWQIFPNATMEE